MSPAISYTLIRIGLFAGSLVVLLLVGVPGWIAAIAAAIIAFAVSYIFFRRQRDEFVAAVQKKPTRDEDAEDVL